MALPTLADRAARLEPSATMAMSARAAELKAQGHAILSFTAGEPDFPTPEHIKEAAAKALRDNVTRYTPPAGTPQVREAIASWIKEEYGLDYPRSGVVASCGAKHALYNIFSVLCQKGDEVLIPAPFWVSFPEQVKLADATPVVVPTSAVNGFQVDAGTVERYVTPHTKALILNSPSNPAGAVYSADTILKMAEMLRRHDIMVISDDCYLKLHFDGLKHTSIATLAGMKERTFVVGSASKTYAMTGWRLGWVAGPQPFLKAIDDFQSQTTSNPTSFVQKAMEAALTGPQECVEEMRQAFERRRNLIVTLARQVPGWSVTVPQGAFYLFPSVEGWLGKTWKGRTITCPLDVAEFLLEEALVATVPGEGFGDSGRIRLSFACSEGQIEEGFDRILKAAGRLE